MAKMRKAAGLIAALILVAFGLLAAQGLPLIGYIIMGIGAAAAIWQAKVLWGAREDPYDLNKLWERPEEADEPEYELLTDETGTPYCHNCGHAVPEPFARCPECGQSVR